MATHFWPIPIFTKQTSAIPLLVKPLESLFLQWLCGGIGRRAGLKIQCPQGRESSILSGATISLSASPINREKPEEPQQVDIFLTMNYLNLSAILR